MPKTHLFVWEIANSYKIMLIFLKKFAQIGENLQEKIQMRLPLCFSLTLETHRLDGKSPDFPSILPGNFGAECPLL